MHEEDERAEVGARDAGQDGEVGGDMEVGKAEEKEGDLTKKEMGREKETFGLKRVDEAVELEADEMVAKAEEKREEIADAGLEERGAGAPERGATVAAREEREVVADVEGIKKGPEIGSEPGPGALATEVLPSPNKCT